MLRAILIGALLSQGCVAHSSGFAPTSAQGRTSRCEFDESCGTVGGGDSDVAMILAAGAALALLSRIVISRLP